MTDRQHDVVDTPVGPLTVVAADGALVGLYMDQQRHLPAVDTFGPRRHGLLPEVAHQLDEYFAGTRTTFDLHWRTSGTPFQQQVWQILAQIPYGRTWTYGELAEQIGVPRASRAVGLANGRNPISIVLPCHRVVGASGALTGYGGGVERKRWLLDLERGTPVLPHTPHPSTVDEAR